MTRKDHPLAQDELTLIQQELLNTANQKLTLRKNGQIATVDARTALVEKYLHRALEGSPQALHQITSMLMAAEQQNRLFIEGRIEEGKTLKAQQQEKLERIIRNSRGAGDNEEIVQAKANNFIVHPDDIVITDNGWHTTGAFDEEALAFIHRQMRFRDAWYLQDAFDNRHPVVDKCDDSKRLNPAKLQRLGLSLTTIDDGERSALLFAQMINQSLPQRFQMAHTDEQATLMRHDSLTKRELAKQCFQAWRKLKIDIKRGWLSPPIVQGIAIYDLIFQTNQAIAKAQNEQRDITTQELSALVMEVMDW